MHPNFLKSMRAPKKRAQDPNAPPRPNLMSHDKKIREITAMHGSETADLRRRMHDLERKFARQNNYLDALHQQLMQKSSKK